MPLIRVSERFQQFIDSLLKKHTIKNREQASDQILDRLQYLEDQASETKIPDNIPQCRRRLEFLSAFYCVQTDRKGLKRIRIIPDLKVCQICKEEKYNLPEPDKRNEGFGEQEVKTPKQVEEIQKAIHDKNNVGFQKAGMKYCPKDTLWVFPSKCEKCKTPCR